MAAEGPSIPDLTDFRVIGRGGFGIVYQAQQKRLNRDVAVKVLNVSGLGDLARRRFDREQRALGSVSNHPSIVSLYDSGFTDDGLPYLVMELMSGGSLGERLVRGESLSTTESVAVVARIADGLQLAHDRGIIHRDIKPENILISEFGEAKLADFGIATLLEGTATMTTSVTTTVEHAPPEILDGAEPSPLSDVYSLGSTLHTLLRGQSPYRHGPDDSVMTIMKRISTEEPADLRDSGIPDGVAAVIEEAMAKDPVLRLATAEEFVQRLRLIGDQLQPGDEPDGETSKPVHQAATTIVQRETAPTPASAIEAEPKESPDDSAEQSHRVGILAGPGRWLVLTAALIGAVAIVSVALTRGGGDDAIPSTTAAALDTGAVEQATTSPAESAATSAVEQATTSPAESTPTSTVESTPTAAETFEALPEIVATHLTGIEVLDHATFDSASDSGSPWSIDTDTSSSTEGGAARLTGFGGDNCCAGHDYGPIEPRGVAVVLTLRYESGSWFTMSIKDGEFDTAAHRRWGMWFESPWRTASMTLDVIEGTNAEVRGQEWADIDVESGVTYQVVLGVEPNGRLIMGLIDEELDELHRLTWDDSGWSVDQWHLSIGVGGDSVVIVDDFWLVEFDSFNG